MSQLRRPQCEYSLPWKPHNLSSKAHQLVCTGIMKLRPEFVLSPFRVPELGIIAGLHTRYFHPYLRRGNRIRKTPVARWCKVRCNLWWPTWWEEMTLGWVGASHWRPFTCHFVSIVDVLRSSVGRLLQGTYLASYLPRAWCSNKHSVITQLTVSSTVFTTCTNYFNIKKGILFTECIYEFPVVWRIKRERVHTLKGWFSY